MELEALLGSTLQAAVPDARWLGPPLGSPQRLPGTLNVVLPGVEAKVLVTRLDVEGLEASAGSACASGSLEPSHVLLAMGLSERDARAGLRLSLGRSTTCAEVRQAVDILVKVSAGPRARR
jgi:cysteine desulfurase